MEGDPAKNFTELLTSYVLPIQAMQLGVEASKDIMTKRKKQERMLTREVEQRE